MRVARRSFLASIIGCAAAAPALLPRRVQADAPQLTLKMHHSFSSVSGVVSRRSQNCSTNCCRSSSVLIRLKADRSSSVMMYETSTSSHCFQGDSNSFRSFFSRAFFF